LILVLNNHSADDNRSWGADLLPAGNQIPSNGWNGIKQRLLEIHV
jgi:hypothetical protein